MIFQEGKTYVFTGPDNYSGEFNTHMQVWKDRKPRKCTYAGAYCGFENISGGRWNYTNSLISNYFKEVDPSDYCMLPEETKLPILDY